MSKQTFIDSKRNCLRIFHELCEAHEFHWPNYDNEGNTLIVSFARDNYPQMSVFAEPDAVAVKLRKQLEREWHREFLN